MKKYVFLIAVASCSATHAVAQTTDYSGAYGFGNSYMVVVQKAAQALILRPELGGITSTVGVGVGMVNGRTIDAEVSNAGLTCFYNARYTFSEDGQSVSGDYLGVRTVPQAAMAGVVCQMPTQAIPIRQKVW